MTTDSLNNFHYSKASLTNSQIDTINILLDSIDFEKLIVSKSLIFDTINIGNNPMYCGPPYGYGFIGSNDSVVVYKPIRDAVHSEKGTKKIFKYLRSISGQLTNDTVEIRQYAIRIGEKYLQTITPPPIQEEVKFVPPVIVDDPVIETD